MAENETGRAAVLARLRGRYDRMQELLRPAEKAARSPVAAVPAPSAMTVVVSGTVGLEAVLRAEQRLAPRPALTRAPRRVRV